jgi:hypothetical protein
MKTFPDLRTKNTAGCLLAVLTLTWSFALAADPVIRYVHFTASGAREQQTAMKLVDTEINQAYVRAKGLMWIKYLIDEKTLETGSVSLWHSRKDLEAFLKSAAYKGVPDKLKPFMKGTMSSVVFDVYEPLAVPLNMVNRAACAVDLLSCTVNGNGDVEAWVDNRDEAVMDCAIVCNYSMPDNSQRTHTINASVPGRFQGRAGWLENAGAKPGTYSGQIMNCRAH